VLCTTVVHNDMHIAYTCERFLEVSIGYGRPM